MTADKKHTNAKKTKTEEKAPEIKPEGITQDQNVLKAHEQADKDIEKDADLSIHSPNDDLDEGETARLGDDKII